MFLKGGGGAGFVKWKVGEEIYVGGWMVLMIINVRIFTHSYPRFTSIHSIKNTYLGLIVCVVRLKTAIITRQGGGRRRRGGGGGGGG